MSKRVRFIGLQNLSVDNLIWVTWRVGYLSFPVGPVQISDLRLKIDELHHPTDFDKRVKAIRDCLHYHNSTLGGDITEQEFFEALTVLVREEDWFQVSHVALPDLPKQAQGLNPQDRFHLIKSMFY